MASMSTFGNTLTDLQAGMNAAQGLEYQRSNFQDQIAAQRMADQLRARSEQQRTQAQRDAALAQIIESRNTRTQQGTQFDAEMRNRLDLGRLDAQSRKDVATIGAGARGMDPRFAQTLADIQAVNSEKQNEANKAKRLSDTRKAILAEQKALKEAQPWFDRGVPNSSPDFWSWRTANPRWGQLADVLQKLDTQATELGYPVGPDGGYVVPDFAEIPVPAMLNPNLPGAGSGYGARPSASSVSAFEPSLFSGGSFVLDPANPASPSRPAPAPFVAPQAPSYTYEVDLNGNFRAVPVARPGDPRLRPVFGDIGIIP